MAVTVNIPSPIRLHDGQWRKSDWLHRSTGRLPTQSSQLYGTNPVNLLEAAVQRVTRNIDVDFDDVAIRGVTVIRDGDITACAANPGFRAATGRA